MCIYMYIYTKNEYICKLRVSLNFTGTVDLQLI